jgi:hypothetical protein
MISDPDSNSSLTGLKSVRYVRITLIESAEENDSARNTKHQFEIYKVSVSVSVIEKRMLPIKRQALSVP